LVGGERHCEYLVQLGMPAESVFFGYDVVDTHYYSRWTKKVREEPGLWRGRLELPERYFLASARFIEKKNLPNLLRAFANYRAESNNRNNSGTSAAWDLVVLGDGELRPRLEALRQELGLTTAVHFPGFRQYDELPMYYALAKAFIHASSVEQWGLVVNEAMAANLPVLVSNRCGCAPTLVRDGENGHTFDPHDIGAMTQCMCKMSALPEQSRQLMGRQSGQIISEFGPERFADGLRRAAAVSTATRTKARNAGDMLLLRALELNNFKRFRQKSLP
jgi:1,2-diacylglycerol 3-alpha-glucosyltransferase